MAKRKRPRIGIVPRVTLGTAAAIGVIPACVAMSCSSGSGQEGSVFAAFDSSYQGGDGVLFDSGLPPETGSVADEAASGDAGSGEADAPTGDGPGSDASNEGG